MKLNDIYIDTMFIAFKDNRKVVALSDKKGGTVCYRGENTQKNELIAYKIEDGILKNEQGVKCDFGLYTVYSDTIRFIELKGSDLNHAIKQIKNSIRNVLDKHSIKVNKVHARIVLSKVRTPDLNSSYEKDLKRILRERNGNFRKATSELREIID